MDLGWKADTCKLQKHHPSYGSHCEEALKLAQTKTETDLDQEEKVFENAENFAEAWAEAKKYQEKYPDANAIPDSELPANFDWRNVKGVDFTSKHRDQGHCGSCYTVSFTQIAEMRLKLKYGKNQPILSPQFLMTCNYMNEGCDGGWPFFHGFMAENGHLVTEECAPYTGKTKGDSCSNYQQCEPHSKIDNTYFVGKGYGDSSEKKMMKEIMRNGLVNGELQAPHIFSMYQSGVLTKTGIKQLHRKVLQLAQTDASRSKKTVHKKLGAVQELTDKTLADYGISWQNLNHSVVIIGWGTDEQSGQKYWIVRNSYGSTWGDHGEFLVSRGNDDFAIESETTAYDPVLCSEAGC
jgi:cathepsin C